MLEAAESGVWGLRRRLARTTCCSGSPSVLGGATSVSSAMRLTASAISAWLFDVTVSPFTSLCEGSRGTRREDVREQKTGPTNDQLSPKFFHFLGSTTGRRHSLDVPCGRVRPVCRGVGDDLADEDPARLQHGDRLVLEVPLVAHRLLHELRAPQQRAQKQTPQSAQQTRSTEVTP